VLRVGPAGPGKTLRAALGFYCPPIWRADYERAVAAVQAALGEEAFTAAWAEGRAMTMDEALAYSRGSNSTSLNDGE
jgi:hypothetical protein